MILAGTVGLLRYPLGTILCLLYLYALAAVGLLSRSHPALKRLFGYEACLASLVLMAAVILASALTPSVPSSKWYFYVPAFFFMTVQGLETMAELCEFRRRNKFALISHVGVFLFVLALVWGSADKRSLFLEAPLDTPVSAEGLPFTVRMHSFTLEEYPPELCMTDAETGKQLDGSGMEIVRMLESARPSDDGSFIPFDHVGAVCAVLVTVEADGEKVKGWVSSGSFLFPERKLDLPDGRCLAMLPRIPKRFVSDISAVNGKGRVYEAALQVNKPLRIGNWAVYQSGYQKERGRFSAVSTLECVYDPWARVKTVACYIILAAALCMMLKLRRLRSLPAIMLSILLAAGFAVIVWLKPGIGGGKPVPALQSPWFVPHVAVYMLAFSVLAVSLLLFLFRREESSDVLARIGWAFLTLGMTMGALWAKEAWGDFWSWDAKETWAVLCWLSYMVYIHMRRRPVSRSVSLAVLVISFLLLQMSWWGVNLLPWVSSIHVY